jgi:hypothetical protein
MQTMRSASGLRFIPLGLVLLSVLACINRPLRRAIPRPHIGAKMSLPQSAERDVDILFVIDNSGSMADEQQMLSEQFESLMTELRSISGGLPNLHVGVVSSDMGGGSCGDNPDAGHLLLGGATLDGSALYIVDVEPLDCDLAKTITLDASDNEIVTCDVAVTDCQTTHCAHAPGTTLRRDHLTGCPRCRNYGGASETLEEVFSQMALIGTTGCGNEQPLNAMRASLDATDSNEGFVRDNAFLAVVLITDEDDCSVKPVHGELLFSESRDVVGGPGYVCFGQAVVCAGDDELPTVDTTGWREGCVARETSRFLEWPENFTSHLESLKGAEMIIVAAIAGPVDATDTGASVEIAPDPGNHDLVGPLFSTQCATHLAERGGAYQGIRLRHVVSDFNTEEDMSWAYTSICEASFTQALRGIGNKIKDLLSYQCLPAPLKGCSDVLYQFDGVGDGADCNNDCRPHCTVVDIYYRDLPEEEQVTLPWCQHVCADGECPDNIDPAAAYQGGHPDERDPALPVPACWQIVYQDACPGSKGAELLVSRQDDPPPRTFTSVACEHLPDRELICNDNLDNDEDCLKDRDDPDCALDATNL